MIESRKNVWGGGRPGGGINQLLQNETDTPSILHYQYILQYWSTAGRHSIEGLGVRWSCPISGSAIEFNLACTFHSATGRIVHATNVGVAMLIRTVRIGND